MSKRTYTIATRASNLAYTQALITLEALKKTHPTSNFEILKLKTKGDSNYTAPLSQFRGEGVFVKELEYALYDKRADFAVHSLKDIPSHVPEDLELTSFLPRETPNDVFITADKKDFRSLKENAVIGSGSPRRIVQMRQQRPDFSFTNIRGNLETRLKKLYNGDYDAIILAAAGLKRLKKQISEHWVLPLDIMLPAIGQGAITIQCRKNDAEIQQMVRAINDRNTEIAVQAERIFMKIMEGGCRIPLAAYAQIRGDAFFMNATVGDQTLQRLEALFKTGQVTEYEKIAEQMAHELKTICRNKSIEY